MHGSCQASATFVGVQQAHEFFAGTGVFGVAAPLAHGGVELLRQSFGFFAEDGKQVGIYSVLHGSSSIACAVAVGGDAASTAGTAVGAAAGAGRCLLLQRDACTGRRGSACNGCCRIACCKVGGRQGFVVFGYFKGNNFNWCCIKHRGRN